MSWLHHPGVRWALPVPLLLVLAPLAWWLFRSTWSRLDEEALLLRQGLAARGALDRRPLVALLVGGFVLAVQEYFCRSSFFEPSIAPGLQRALAGNAEALAWFAQYRELLGRSYWGLSRLLTYAAPLLVWPLVFRDERLVDQGLRLRGFLSHAWIYAGFVVVMVPVLVLAARADDFGTYYPIYREAGRSWTDFVTWELVYLAQFLGVELFFRGWWLRATRSLGAAAIFAMAVPYAMIHFAKPYLESCGALVAGVVLGSLAATTRSIWSGFLVHATVAVLMDILALDRRGSLPRAITPNGPATLAFPPVQVVVWSIWASALVVVLVTVWRRRDDLRRGWRRARGGISPR